jgi:hypothetical protein
MGTLENLKEIADLVKKMGDIDLYRRIVEIEGEVVELTRRNRALESEHQELSHRVEFAARMTFTEPFWYADSDVVPFCPQCWESDRTAVHLLYKGHMSGGHRYDCPNCKNLFCSAATPAPRRA